MTYELIVDFLGRPLLANAAHKMHHQVASRARREWRDAFCQLATIQRVPSFDAIKVTTWAEYPTRRSLPDVDGTAPSVKGAIDGLVLAGVIPDDTAKHLRSVEYLAPVVRTGATPALVIQIDEVEA